MPKVSNKLFSENSPLSLFHNELTRRKQLTAEVPSAKSFQDEESAVEADQIGVKSANLEFLQHEQKVQVNSWTLSGR